MPELTNFLNTLYKLDLRHSNIKDLGDDLVNQAVLDALLEYSELDPRGSRQTTITVSIDDEEIVLPVDCLVLSDDTAFLLYYGYSRGKNPVPGAYPIANYYNANYLGTTPLSNTTDLPYANTVSQPSVIPTSTSDLGRITILLNSPATAAREHIIRYDGYHMISNDPEMNTIPIPSRGKFRELCLYYLYEARQRQAIDEGDFDKAKECEKLATKYSQVRDRISGGCYGALA